jgi:hypothetical protein
VAEPIFADLFLWHDEGYIEIAVFRHRGVITAVTRRPEAGAPRDLRQDPVFLDCDNSIGTAAGSADTAGNWQLYR